MSTKTANFNVGQLVIHKLFNYRGVIIDVDPVYQGTEEWYDQVALIRPAKDQPWYRVLVHNGVHETYVAERNLEEDDTTEPINHPQINEYFNDFKNNHYINRNRTN